MDENSIINFLMQMLSQAGGTMLDAGMSSSATPFAQNSDFLRLIGMPTMTRPRNLALFNLQQSSMKLMESATGTPQINQLVDIVSSATGIDVNDGMRSDITKFVANNEFLSGAFGGTGYDQLYASVEAVSRVNPEALMTLDAPGTVQQIEELQNAITERFFSGDGSVRDKYRKSISGTGDLSDIMDYASRSGMLRSVAEFEQTNTGPKLSIQKEKYLKLIDDLAELSSVGTAVFGSATTQEALRQAAMYTGVSGPNMRDNQGVAMERLNKIQFTAAMTGADAGALYTNVLNQKEQLTQSGFSALAAGGIAADTTMSATMFQDYMTNAASMTGRNFAIPTVAELTQAASTSFIGNLNEYDNKVRLLQEFGAQYDFTFSADELANPDSTIGAYADNAQDLFSKLDTDRQESFRENVIKKANKDDIIEGTLFNLGLTDDVRLNEQTVLANEYIQAQKPLTQFLEERLETSAQTQSEIENELFESSEAKALYAENETLNNLYNNMQAGVPGSRDDLLEELGSRDLKPRSMNVTEAARAIYETDEEAFAKYMTLIKSENPEERAANLTAFASYMENNGLELPDNFDRDLLDLSESEQADVYNLSRNLETNRVLQNQDYSELDFEAVTKNAGKTRVQSSLLQLYEDQTGTFRFLEASLLANDPEKKSEMHQQFLASAEANGINVKDYYGVDLTDLENENPFADMYRGNEEVFAAYNELREDPENKELQEEFNQLAANNRLSNIDFSQTSIEEQEDWARKNATATVLALQESRKRLGGDGMNQMSIEKMLNLSDHYEGVNISHLKDKTTLAGNFVKFLTKGTEYDTEFADNNMEALKDKKGIFEGTLETITFESLQKLTEADVEALNDLGLTVDQSQEEFQKALQSDKAQTFVTDRVAMAVDDENSFLINKKDATSIQAANKIKNTVMDVLTALEGIGIPVREIEKEEKINSAEDER